MSLGCSACDERTKWSYMGVPEAIKGNGCPTIDHGSWFSYAFDQERLCAFDPDTGESLWHIDEDTHEVVWDINPETYDMEAGKFYALA